MNLQITDTTVCLRPIKDEDLNILNEIYGGTREKELQQLTHWTEQQKQAFLQQQFMVQHEYYQKNYIGANFYIIQKNNQPIGRLYIHQSYQNNGIRIIDIALLSKWQKQGIGNQLITDILNCAKKTNNPVSIHVESFNPAMKLYERLGFKKISETNGVYYLMQWKQKF